MITYGLKYKAEYTDCSGNAWRIEIKKKGYTGAVLKRALGSAPVLKCDDGGQIKGTSLEFSLEAVCEGELTEFYTTDNKMFRVEVYKENAIFWCGFILPELYSERYVAAPYDVVLSATDGLGILKDEYFGLLQQRATLADILEGCFQKTGLALTHRYASSLREVHQTGKLMFAEVDIDVKTFEGLSCYEVLEKLCASTDSFITQANGAWFIGRYCDLDADLLEYDPKTGSITELQNDQKDLGRLYAADVAPVGELDMSIIPAKKTVRFTAGYGQYPSFLKNYDFSDKLANWEYETYENCVRVYQYNDKYQLLLFPMGKVYQTGKTFPGGFIRQRCQVKKTEMDVSLTFDAALGEPRDKLEVLRQRLYVKVNIIGDDGKAYYLTNEGWKTEEREIEIQLGLSPWKTFKEMGVEKAGYWSESQEEVKIIAHGFPASGILTVAIRNDCYIMITANGQKLGGTAFLSNVRFSALVENNIALTLPLCASASASSADVDVPIVDAPVGENMEGAFYNVMWVRDNPTSSWTADGLGANTFLDVTIKSVCARLEVTRNQLRGTITGNYTFYSLIRDLFSGKLFYLKEYTYNLLEDEIDCTLVEFIRASERDIAPIGGIEKNSNNENGKAIGFFEILSQWFYEKDSRLYCKLDFVGEKEIAAYGWSDDDGGTGGGWDLIDNLTSDRTDAGLTANMGRYLKALIDSKASDWNSITGKPLTFPPSTHGHPEYALKEHTHPYLPLTGGKLTDQLVIETVDCGYFNEGIRINRSTNNWAGIMIGTAPGSVTNHDSQGWFVAMTPDRNFMINPVSSLYNQGLDLYRGGDVYWRGKRLAYADELTTSVLYKEVGINATGLDQNKWYPVSVYLGQHDQVKIRVIVSLQGNKPSWATHASGFSCRFVEVVNGSGWGTNQVNRRILANDYSYASVNPIGGVTQNTNASTEIIYVRGGGYYYFHVSTGATPILNSSGYNWVSGSYSYSAPVRDSALNDNWNWIGSSDIINRANKLTTARSIWGQSFDGSGNVDGDFHINGWIRSYGNIGWYSQTYGGGIHMVENKWVRIYGNKGFYSDGVVDNIGIGGHNVGIKLYNYYHTGINLANNACTWGIYSNSNGNLYIGRRVGNVDDSSGHYVGMFGYDFLQVNGNIVATGEITAYQASDRRLKDNVHSLVGTASDILRNLRPVEFDWNETAMQLNPAKHKHDYSFIADEYEQVFPWAMGMIHEKYQAIDKNVIVPLLVAGHQETAGKMAELDQRVMALEKENKELKQIIGK